MSARVRHHSRGRVPKPRLTEAAFHPEFAGDRQREGVCVYRVMVTILMVMDPETVTALQQLAKIVAPVAAAPTVGDLVKRVLGPTADLFGERIRKCFERSDQMVHDSRETPQNAAPNIVIPLIQAVALAEHETIQEMFAALLTNARIPDGNAARPSFISIVSQLAPDEAILFKAIGILSDEYRVFQLGFNHIPQPQRMTQATSFVKHYLVKVRNALPVVQGESDGNRKLRG